MRTSLSLWLTAIILLTVVAFFIVFQPVTTQPRKDPSDTSLYLRPYGVKKFEATRPPDPYTSIGQTNIYLYSPQHDLRLGLDLRGGMHVVLSIPDRAEFNYTLKPALAGPNDAALKQQKLLAALADPQAGLGPEMVNDPAKLSAIVRESQVQIITQARSADDAKYQLTKIDAAMAKVFDKGQYSEPDSDKIFKPVDADTQKSVLSIMEKRVNPEGTKEVQGYTKGINQVVLEIPGEKDPAKVEKMIGTTAHMEFRLVPDSIRVDLDHATNQVTIYRSGTPITDKEAIDASYLVVPGSALKPNCDVTYDNQHNWAVSFSMKDNESSERFGAVTASNIGKQLAIVLDNKIITAPVIKDAIPGNGIISGGFSMESAKELATLLNAGALPVPVQIVENRTVSATLGAASVSQSLFAGLIGLIAVLIFMVAYYRLPGLMADLALTVYIFLLLGVMWLWRDFTLTLPGIAGVIISIGMAVDANVIIFERLKEELRSQKPVETAIDVAFSRAWTAILDSNVASLITGTVLYLLGTGTVKGFAVTLIIGVLVSMFTAVTVTRLFMKLLVRTKAGHNLAMYGI